MRINTAVYLFALVSTVSTAGDCLAGATSTFASSSEGWVSVMLAYPQPSAPPTPLGNSPYTANYGAYGNPSEHGISLLDPDGSDSTGNTQYWSAPAKFLGDQAATYGGSVSYDLVDTFAGYGSFAQEDAIVVGGGLTLVFVLPQTAWPDGTLNWKRVSIPLTETGWTINSPSGSAATAADMKAALSSLTHIYLRAEYQLGPDTAYLARVTLKNGPSAASIERGAQTDYLGEGKAGYTVWRPSTGYWYSIDGAGKSATGQWGAPTDLPVIGDFDGDGKSDFAVFRPETGFWYIKLSSDSQVEAQQWGAATDVPVAGDFDGDGKTDLAVYRPATGYWYIIQSSDNTVVAKQFGEATDVPVVGDFDGDGKSDVAVYRPSTGYWYITLSSTNTVVATQWGEATDIPTTGDYDGDGKTDIAVYRPTTGYWYIIQSSNGQTVAKQWGAVGDTPVARDYDGDGKTDIAVWRPTTGYWYVVQSSTGGTIAQQWGAPTDIPVNSLRR